MDEARKRTRSSWCAMRARCLSPSNGNFKRYGGAGVTICQAWSSFDQFVADMGLRPSGTTLDRFPDSKGNYEPSNCRWATSAQQNANRKVSYGLIRHGGRSMTARAWELALGLSKGRVQKRLNGGWSVAQALTIQPARDRRFTASLRSAAPDLLRRACDVLEGLDGIPLRGAMPTRVAKLRAAVDAAMRGAA